MASKATSLWRSACTGINGNRSFSTSNRSKLRSSFSSITNFLHAYDADPRPEKRDFVPVYVALGMILISSTLGAYMGLLHLMYEPSVRVNKKKRETLPEVEMPDEVVNEAKQFITKSLFRKVAYVQEFDPDHTISDPIRKDVFGLPPLKAETLKDVGVEPNFK
ncbi:hypothetical protein NE237_009033 [Protea cynaroides]|uniref:Uncharacterized protein n=1 Tax=Protea cynaroides TaxID=273540 RepID=A0A9Q0QZX3_9MAGN|nr:hypothetical protein NE237_009033 [Protea cynaroides]